MFDTVSSHCTPPGAHHPDTTNMFGHEKEGEKVTFCLARGGWGYSLIWAIKVCAAPKGGGVKIKFKPE